VRDRLHRSRQQHATEQHSEERDRGVDDGEAAYGRAHNRAGTGMDSLGW
jgi:hypothetical protein